MAAKGTRVTQKEKEKMWQLFQDGNSFVKIGKKLRRSPDTVSRYVREYEARQIGVTCGVAACNACKFN